MSESDLVCFIDDDEAVRDSVGLLLREHEIEVSSFASAEEFLAELETGFRPACIVSDVRSSTDPAAAPTPGAPVASDVGPGSVDASPESSPESVDASCSPGCAFAAVT